MSRVDASEIPSHLEIGRPHDVLVTAHVDGKDVKDATSHRWRIRAICRHVQGDDHEKHQFESEPKPLENYILEAKLPIVAWREGTYSVTFDLIELIEAQKTERIVVSSPPHTYEGVRMAEVARGGGHGRGGGHEPPRFEPVTRVALQRSSVPKTLDEILWMAIRRSCEDLSYPHYHRFVEDLLRPEAPDKPQKPNCTEGADERMGVSRAFYQGKLNELAPRRALPFPGVDGYRWLKIATEVFVMSRCGVVPDFGPRDIVDAELRMGEPLHHAPAELDERLHRYLGRDEYHHEMLPYHRIVMEKLQGNRILPLGADDDGKNEVCYGVLESKVRFPCMIELIWSYWHEEAMVVQSMNAISQRFQNRRGPGERDPLAQLEIDPLRPLNNLLWGHLQDEGNRLSVIRRAHEYDHQYGISLHGRAVGALRSADSRSKFLESFHNLLYKCQQFYRQDDDATVIADGFPVLNALKETHYLLAHGAHNQFGDLPATSRQEMLMQLWLLGRPEMREFLGGRIMVPHPEAWMDRVDAMKSLQGWTDTGAVHFRDLGVFGEQVLLAIRYGAWSLINNRDHAANWARWWRTEIQGYIHAYRAVTGVDLATDPSSAHNVEERYLPPSVHLRNRLALQRRR